MKCVYKVYLRSAVPAQVPLWTKQARSNGRRKWIWCVQFSTEHLAIAAVHSRKSVLPLLALQNPSTAS